MNQLLHRSLTMRAKYLHLAVGFVLFLLFYIFICKRKPNDPGSGCLSESDWLQETSSDIVERHRLAVQRLKPDLKWMKNGVLSHTLSTIPVRFPNCSSTVFLLVLVASSPNNFEERNAIRGSWASLPPSVAGDHVFKGVLRYYDTRNAFKTVFLMGRSADKKTQALINREMEIYNDIVFGEFEDNYNNLVYKTRLGMTWAYLQCSSAYVLKTDDDVFINTWQLLPWAVRSDELNFYSGWCNYRSKVSRNKLSKWWVNS